MFLLTVSAIFKRICCLLSTSSQAEQQIRADDDKERGRQRITNPRLKLRGKKNNKQTKTGIVVRETGINFFNFVCVLRKAGNNLAV